MKVSSHVHDPRPSHALRITATRYIPDNPPTTGLTLILGHAVGLHKETWEPLLEYLFNLDAVSDGKEAKILEAWSIEFPTHGESAVLNEEVIAADFSGSCTGWEYPRGMLSFLNSNPGGVNFYERKLVALGHSNGLGSLLLRHLQPALPFICFVLLDATAAKKTPERDDMQRMLTQITWNKKDTWSSREAALRDLAKQPGTRNWHPQVLRLFTEKGLRDHPTSHYPDSRAFNGVTLSCSKAYEAACYRLNDHNEISFDVLQALYRKGPPVHFILSKNDEFGATKLKATMIAPEPESGKQPASVQWIEKGGHMFVQTVPQATANAVFTLLYKIDTNVESFSSSDGRKQLTLLFVPDSRKSRQRYAPR